MNEVAMLTGVLVCPQARPWPSAVHPEWQLLPTSFVEVPVDGDEVVIAFVAMVAEVAS